MIDLTPLEVRQKRGDFPRGLRGYDAGQVDDFLALVADRLDALVKENVALRDRLGRLEEQVADYRNRENALTEALVTAQEMREEVRRQSSREAELLREEARQEAERIRAGAMQATEREEEILRRLRARQAQLIRSYRSFLEREMAELAVVADTLAFDPGNAAPGTDSHDEGSQAGAAGTLVDGPEEGFAEGIAALAASDRRPAPAAAAPRTGSAEADEPEDGEDGENGGAADEGAPAGEAARAPAARVDEARGETVAPAGEGGRASGEGARAAGDDPFPWEDEGDQVEAEPDPWAEGLDFGGRPRGEREGEGRSPSPRAGLEGRDASGTPDEPESGAADASAPSPARPASGREGDEPEWLTSLLREP